jgi:hypothetical protein
MKKDADYEAELASENRHHHVPQDFRERFALRLVKFLRVAIATVPWFWKPLPQFQEWWAGCCNTLRRCAISATIKAGSGS